jgi:hypothetical protein
VVATRSLRRLVRIPAPLVDLVGAVLLLGLGLAGLGLVATRAR